MAKLNLTKADAARRQIDAAIRLLFSGEDDVAVLTLAAAALRIVRDLSEKSGKNPIYAAWNAAVRPGMQNEMWKAFSAPANFLKHADRDPTEILDNVDEGLGEAFAFMATLFYAGLGHPSTKEMAYLMSYVFARNPNFLQEDAPFKAVFDKDLSFLREKSRRDALREIDEMHRVLPVGQWPLKFTPGKSTS